MFFFGASTKRQKQKRENLVSVRQNIQLPDRRITHREDKIARESCLPRNDNCTEQQTSVNTHTHALSRSHNNKKNNNATQHARTNANPSVNRRSCWQFYIPFLIVGRAASRVDRLPVVPSHHVPRDVTHLRLLVLLLLLLNLAVVRAVPLGVRLRVRTAQLLIVRLVLGVVTVRVVITGCGGRSAVLLCTVRRRARRSVFAGARITRILAIIWLATSARTVTLRSVTTSGAVVLVLVASIVAIAPFVSVAVAIIWNEIESVTLSSYIWIFKTLPFRPSSR